MNFLTLLLIAIGLSFDSFAVSVCSGLSMCRKSIRFLDTFKIAFFLAIFQAFMPVIGWYLGSTVKGYIDHVDHWIAFGLLSILGIKMILEGRKVKGKRIKNPTRLRILIPMSLATSIDALAVGITFAFLVESMLVPALVIGFVTLTLAFLGLYMGRKLGVKLAGKAEVFGGIILIGIGLKIVLEHLLVL